MPKVTLRSRGDAPELVPLARLQAGGSLSGRPAPSVRGEEGPGTVACWVNVVRGWARRRRDEVRGGARRGGGGVPVAQERTFR